MSRRTRIRRRVGWKAALIALISVTVASSALVSAIANTSRATNPGMVARLPGGDAVAEGLELDRQLLGDPRIARDPRAQKVALHSLRGSALNAPALRFLALSPRANRSNELVLTHLAERVTRRDLMTQVMLIEASVQAGSVEQALVHYDRALRTGASARQLLFPVLRSAMADPEIGRALRPYLTADRSWAEPFVRDALASGISPTLVVDLLLAAPISPGRAELSNALSSLLVGDLAAAKQYEALRRYYLSLPKASPALLHTASFTSENTDPARVPLAWQLSDSGDLGASFERGHTEEARQAHVFATSGKSGIALRKLLYLAPGSYVLNEKRALISGEAEASAHWLLSCVVGPQIGVVWTGKGESREAFTVPTGCTAQMLELAAAGGESQQGLDVTIEQLELRRVSR